MKDYLRDNLSDEEKSFIYGIIRKTSLKFIRNLIKVKQNEILYLDSDDAPEELLIDDNSNNISDLKIFSKYEKEQIVKTLENIALEAGLKKFITPLTFNEKLVVFLLYVENYQVNEVATLLDVTRMSIWKRQKSIKRKIEKVKESIDNGR